ncbi:GspB domain-containing protein [Idiomarina ramblicola]|uniref:Type II secretory pathway component n=1 Tax=Idiomarina ramblicola TaxID=263724 RepID=A0A432Z263_9GAMM|nr:GspB domain-containing protein [Idiomarina ramblicola]RUO71957.1 Type II secretory pathway component [Idiomarina ramblicola]
MRRILLILLAVLSAAAVAQERDPTQPPVSNNQTASSLDSWAQKLELTQIFYSESSQAARLNGEWVKPGESIGGLTVTSIKPNSVIVKKNNEVVEITLFKPMKQNKKGSPGAVQ